MPVKFERPSEPPNQLLVTFETYAEYQNTLQDGEAHKLYLKALFLHMVGRMMPITCTIRVPIDKQNMTKAAIKAAEKMGATGGVLVLNAVCAHRELDGYVLTRDMLPLVADSQHPVAKKIARELASQDDHSNKEV